MAMNLSSLAAMRFINKNEIKIIGLKLAERLLPILLPRQLIEKRFEAAVFK